MFNQGYASFFVIRYIAAKQHRGGAKVCKPFMSEAMRSLGGPAHFVFCKIHQVDRPQEIWEDMKDYRRQESGMYTWLKRQNPRFGCL